MKDSNTISAAVDQLPSLDDAFIDAFPELPQTPLYVNQIKDIPWWPLEVAIALARGQPELARVLYYLEDYTDPRVAPHLEWLRNFEGYTNALAAIAQGELAEKTGAKPNGAKYLVRLAEADKKWGCFPVAFSFAKYWTELVPRIRHSRGTWYFYYDTEVVEAPNNGSIRLLVTLMRDQGQVFTAKQLLHRVESNALHLPQPESRVTFALTDLLADYEALLRTKQTPRVIAKRLKLRDQLLKEYGADGPPAVFDRNEELTHGTLLRGVLDGIEYFRERHPELHTTLEMGVWRTDFFCFANEPELFWSAKLPA